MQRTKYFDDTRPSDTQLNYTESSKASAIKRRLLADSQLGVVEGFRITVNGADATKIDIGAGEGYTGGTYLINTFEGEGSGERISTTTDTVTGTISVGNIIQGQALADYTLGTKNYVSLAYSENEGYTLAERSFPFTAHNTVVTDSYSVSVMTETAWNSLSATAINNRVLVAIVTAKGAGNALTSADIDQVVQPKAHPTAAQPSSLTGVEITAISPETGLGSGTLRFNPATSAVYWTAPGDTEGAAVTISSSGAYTVYSNDTAYYIVISATFASLPVAAVSETIQVRGLYGRQIPLFSAKDTAHRDLVGSGIPTASNPHGLTLDDLPGGTFDHADYFHVNGISKDSVDTLLECTVDGINERILITNPGGANDKFLIDGSQYTTINGVAAGIDGTVLFNVLPVPDDGRYLIYLDSSANPGRVKIGEDLWDANIRVVDIHVTTTGNATIDWDSTNLTLVFTAPGDAAGVPVFTLVGTGAGPFGYYKLYSNNGTDYVIVYCDGNLLGVTNSSTFAVNKSDAAGSPTADETILKLAVVGWDSGAGTLTVLDDVRSFTTVDNRTQFLEEHDADGRHSKVFQHQLRAEAERRAVHGSAESYTGVYGVAGEDVGVYGSAAVSTGVNAVASVIGVAATATATGVYALAGNSAGVFIAATNTGVYASADNRAFYGLVNGDTAVYGSADNIGAYFLAAVDTGVFASVKGNIGGQFSAIGDTGIQAVALGNYGVRATASNYGVNATATAAGATALAGYADTGVVGVGGDLGVYGYVYGVGDIGVMGEANILGVATGVYGSVDQGTGVVGSAADGTGVYGQGGFGIHASGALPAIFEADAGGAIPMLSFSNAILAAGKLEENSYLGIFVDGDPYYIKLYT